MHRFLAILFFAGIAFQCNAQELKDYRSSKNPYYWQNRKPDAAYWQQDVKYTIHATIDEITNTIIADQSLEYWNNSPDTLYFVYMHLYQNAFIKGSHLHELEAAKNVAQRLGKYEAAGLGTVVENIKVNGEKVKTELDNTILKIYLPKPLYPNTYTTLTLDFTTYYDRGATRRRMQMYPAWGFMHYNGVQWYPKISVYDRKFGWDTYQHLNKEFYGDFGVFDVSLDFASNYIVEATGVLQNRKEVLPDDLRARLDMKNFASKPMNEAPSVIIPYKKGERKTWKFHAENVHDFAFTADPSYRIATAYWNGIECVGIAQEPHASGWQNSAEYVAKVVKTFSEDIGMYAYPKMVAADANDGMEYPMLTLDGGSNPGYHGLLVHEIGHNWFYGMVGSNETYRAAMDEGFTQFLTAWGLKRIDGEYIGEVKPGSKRKPWAAEPAKPVDVRVFNFYILNALKQDELSLNTHSNDFHDALGHEGGYRLVYYKTAAMLYNLQYTLGDSLFLAAIQHYFNQWKMAHPYFEDFRASIIQFTKVDLNWFFDEWFETTKTIDYSINSIRKAKGRDSFHIYFARNGQMQMPIDFTITAKDGHQQSYHIPNTWFQKNTEAIMLPKWYGWSKLHDTYTASVHVPSGIRSVVIDTSERLADIYPLDNYKKRGSLIPAAFKIQTDFGQAHPIDRKHYRVYIRPDLWWNNVDGIKAGIHVEGDYLNTMHKLDAAIWWNTHVLQTEEYLSYKSQGWYDKYLPFNFTFNYISPVSQHNTKLQTQFNVRMLDGLNYGRIGNNWVPNDNYKLEFFFLGMNRTIRYDFDYLLYKNEWSSDRKRSNNSLNLVINRKYHYKRGTGYSTMSLRAPFLTGNETNAFNYSYLQLEHVNYNNLKRLEIRTRLFARAGMGSSMPYESALWLAGANPEEMMEDKYTRSVGFVPDEWRGISRYETNHFQQGGGLNLRGYAGYFIADEREGEILIGYKGRSGISGNIEVDIDNYIRLQPKLTKNWLHIDLYAFADAGLIELSRISDLNSYFNTTSTEMWSDLRIDAGLGFAATIKDWGRFKTAKPLTLRFDMPFFINRPPYANPQYANFRYVVGIGRAF